LFEKEKKRGLTLGEGAIAGVEKQEGTSECSLPTAKGGKRGVANDAIDVQGGV